MAFPRAFSPTFPRPFGGQGAAAPTVLFYDTFTGADGTALTSHTPDIDTVGGGWSVVTTLSNGSTATATIQTNALAVTGVQVAGGLCRLYATTNIGVANCTVSAKCQLVSASVSSNLFLRWVDTNNFWSFYVSSSSFTLFERTGGSDLTRLSVASTNTIGAVYTLKVVLLGNNLACYVNGSPIGNYTSTAHATNTRHGVGKHQSSTATPIFDDFEILP